MEVMMHGTEHSGEAENGTLDPHSFRVPGTESIAPQATHSILAAQRSLTGSDLLFFL